MTYEELFEQAVEEHKAWGLVTLTIISRVIAKGYDVDQFEQDVEDQVNGE